MVRLESTLKLSLSLFTLFLPWTARRWMLERAFGYQLHPTSRLGFSWVFPRESLVMGEYASIGHFTVCRGPDRVHIGPHARIGNANWITGYPRTASRQVFEHSRAPQLILGQHAAITNRHYIDCTDAIVLEQFALIAGVRSVLLTHSIDLQAGRQACGPIHIGAYCHVGTNCILLPRTSLPGYSILGANSLLNRRLTTSFRLYAGSPARDRGEVDQGAGWFVREKGVL